MIYTYGHALLELMLGCEGRVFFMLVNLQPSTKLQSIHTPIHKLTERQHTNAHSNFSLLSDLSEYMT